MTDAERKFWLVLRDRQLDGFKFRRQFPIGSWTADFVCLEAALVVEVDGGQHGGVRDDVRDASLLSMGFRTVRFWNNDVLNNLDGVVTVIRGALADEASV